MALFTTWIYIGNHDWILDQHNNMDGHNTDLSEAGEMWRANAAPWAHKIQYSGD